MSSVIGLEVQKRNNGRGDVDDTPRFGKWVSLTCGSDRFDIDRGLVHCKFSTTDFMASIGGDAIVVVPATFRFASQMVAHAVLRGFDRGGGFVEIAVRRATIRCARQYRFAYVDGRRYEVVGVSDDAFVFVHRQGPCDCGGVGNDYDVEHGTGDVLKLESSTQSEIVNLASTITLERPAAATVKLRSFVSSLMDMRSSHPPCTVCKVPSNYRQVLECLTENVEHLSDVDSNVDRECIRAFKCLKNCQSLLEYLEIKIKMVNREVENCQQFIYGLVSSLMQNRRAIFRTGNSTIFVKIDERLESECFARKCFMDSIINSQKQIISKLETTYEEMSIVMKTTRLFAKVL